MRYSYFVFKYIRSFPFVRSLMTLLVFALIYSAVVTYTSTFIYNSVVLRFVESNNPIYVHLCRRLHLYAINAYLVPFYY